MIKLLILCSEGLELFVQEEIKNFGLTFIKKDIGMIIASSDSMSVCLKYLYGTHIAKFINVLFDEGVHEKELETIEKRKLKIESDLVLKEKKWTVKIMHSNDCALSSKHVLPIVQKKLLNLVSPNFSFNKYDFSFTFYLTKTCWYFGIALSYIDLSRRDYRLFLGRSSLLGTTASASLFMADYSSDKLLLDPLTQCGTIAIEASLISRKQSPRYFEKNRLILSILDKYQNLAKVIFSEFDTLRVQKEKNVFAFDENFPRLRSAQKNSKVADVNKTIKFSRQDIDCIDLKCEPCSIDLVLTNPDMLNRKKDKIFLNRTSVILKKNGTLGIITREKERWFDLAGFKREKESIIYQGKEKWYIVIFTKQKLLTKQKNN